MSESLKKQLAVAVIEKDHLAGITPTSQMINRSGKFQAKGRVMASFYRAIRLIADLKLQLLFYDKSTLEISIK